MVHQGPPLSDQTLVHFICGLPASLSFAFKASRFALIAAGRTK
jgi:hypothetical protein